jgi:hypothetical protein
LTQTGSVVQPADPASSDRISSVAGFGRILAGSDWILENKGDEPAGVRNLTPEKGVAAFGWI